MKYQIASDIQRNGLGLELLGKRGDPIAEVFRWDGQNRVTVSTFGNDISFTELSTFMEEATKELSPFEDGTPLFNN